MFSSALSGLSFNAIDTAPMGCPAQCPRARRKGSFIVNKTLWCLLYIYLTFSRLAVGISIRKNGSSNRNMAAGDPALVADGLVGRLPSWELALLSKWISDAFKKLAVH
ncbi:hypothetical protein KIL84_001583 [Mauremys mutica]|uniref:Uncharacterized protein n=1 Tax=Mauremys mutica TaxID=74926 RepID=A0A9D3XHH2_9SAUR|nr:hypothetical protein KIL84_001583 [Mauremys mutica]